MGTDIEGALFLAKMFAFPMKTFKQYYDCENQKPWYIQIKYIFQQIKPFTIIKQNEVIGKFPA